MELILHVCCETVAVDPGGILERPGEEATGLSRVFPLAVRSHLLEDCLIDLEAEILNVHDRHDAQ